MNSNEKKMNCEKAIRIDKEEMQVEIFKANDDNDIPRNFTYD